MFTKSESQLMSMCMRTARVSSPYLTGLLRHEGIILRPTADGFKIIWDGSRVFYIGFVNEGIRGNEQNKGFIEESIRQILQVVTEYFSGKSDQTYARARSQNASLLEKEKFMDDNHRKMLNFDLKMNQLRYKYSDIEFNEYLAKSGGRK